LDEKPLTPEAQRARDEILDYLLQGRQVDALREYLHASGKQFSEARSVVDRLSQILDKPGLDDAEQAFLAEFRASLNNPQRRPSEILLAELSKRASTRVRHPEARTLQPLPNRTPKPVEQAVETTDSYAADGTPNAETALQNHQLPETSAPLPLQIAALMVAIAANLAAGWAMLVWMGTAGKIFLGLYLVAPLMGMLSEFAFGPAPWSWRNLGLGYLAFLVRLLLLVGMQIAVVLMGLLVGPVWVGMLVLTLIELVSRALLEAAPNWLLCYWAGIEGSLCVPFELLYHGLSAGGLYVLMRHHDRLLDAGVALPKRWIDSFERRMTH